MQWLNEVLNSDGSQSIVPNIPTYILFTVDMEKKHPTLLEDAIFLRTNLYYYLYDSVLSHPRCNSFNRKLLESCLVSIDIIQKKYLTGSNSREDLCDTGSLMNNQAHQLEYVLRIKPKTMN